jgi:sugar phosphate permease
MQPTTDPPPMAPQPGDQKSSRSQPYVVGVCLFLGYVGVYLCRKNLAVAIPLLRQAFGASRAGVGLVATAGDLAYTVGKFAGGPIVDRVSGRTGFLAALAGVAVFSALSMLSPGLGALAILYALNRLAGAGAWSSMMKLTASWFRPGRLGAAIGALSLSYVLGGAAGIAFARHMAGFGWRAVMGVPALVVAALLIVCARFVRPGPLVEAPAGDPADRAAGAGGGAAGERLKVRAPIIREVLYLLRRPQFQTICILSFTLTLVRDALGTWSVDFLLSIQHSHRSLALAALQSTGFELAGAASVLGLGLVYDRLAPAPRRALIIALLALLGGVLIALSSVSKGHPGAAAPLLAAAGFLLYGPYGVLGGVVAVETGGTELAGTAVGISDGIGYLASGLVGVGIGRLVDWRGYPTAFALLAGMTLFAALAASRLRLTPPEVRNP